MNALRPATARTPLHHWQVAHGAHFVERDGWLVVDSYTSVDEEIAATRNSLTLADVSAFAKISVLGNGVADYCQKLLGESRASRPLGIARFDAEGPVLACRLVHDHVLFLAQTSNAAGLWQKLKQLQCDQATVETEVTSAYAGFCLAGPDINQVLGPWTALDVSAALPPASCAETNVAGVHALLVRPPENGRLLVYVAWDLGEHIWMRLLESGAPCGMRPVGLRPIVIERSRIPGGISPSGEPYRAGST